MHPAIEGLKGEQALEILNQLLHNQTISEEQLHQVDRRNSKHGSDSLSTAAAPTTTDASLSKPIPQPVTTVRTRHIALQIYYDGGPYSGLAQNVGQDDDHSIERELFAALIKAKLVHNRECSSYSRSGRTDRGVSANHQVVALQLKSAFALQASFTEPSSAQPPHEPLSECDLPHNSFDSLTVWIPSRKHPTQFVQKQNLREYRYDSILNNLLPPQIRVWGWTPVSADFSARFSTLSRTYRYFFVPRSGWCLKTMQVALQMLVGRHDFRNFCKMDVEKVSNFERVVHSAQLAVVEKNCENDDVPVVCYVQIVGQAFLWHQIRCIVAVLFLVAKGLEEPTIVTELLNVQKHPGKPSYDMADERPLVLHDCTYKNVPFQYTTSNLWNVQCGLEQQWEELVLAAARIRNSLESMKDYCVYANELSEFAENKLLARHKKQRGALPPTPRPLAGESLTWGDALEWLGDHGLVPDPDRSVDFCYKPLLSRHKGTTYEEKVASLQRSSKRKSRYEENVIRKRTTKEQDAAFYEHMTQQGGASKS